MPRDPHETRERAGRLPDGRPAAFAAWEVDWLKAGRLPPGERLRGVAAASPNVRERRPGEYRGPCPACGADGAYTVRLDPNGDVQRHCFKGCTRAAIQEAAPASYELLFAAPLPAGWTDDGGEHGAFLRQWMADHRDAPNDAAPARRSGVRVGLYAFGASSSRAGAAEFDAACSSLAQDAGRDPSRLYGRRGIIADILDLPSRPVSRLRAGGPVKRAGRWVAEPSRWRLNLAKHAAGTAPANPAAELPHVAPGGDFARGTRGDLWWTLDTWPHYGAEPLTVAASADASGLSRSAVRKHFARLLLLGMAVEVQPDADATETTRRRGRPPRTLVLLPAVSAAIADCDGEELARLARLAPSRRNLRERAAHKIARASMEFAAELAAPGWPVTARKGYTAAWRERAAAADRAAAELADVAASALDDAATGAGA